MSQAEPTLYEDPNRFARPASLELYETSAVFHGYQEFSLTRDAVRVLPQDAALDAKRRMLAPFFAPRYLARRSLLDLGANAGFFSFWALQRGATRSVAVDLDEEYVRMMEDARARLGFDGLEVAKANVVDWEQPADVVLGLALIHWIYSCTAVYGTLHSAVGKLADLTGYMLIVEWVDPADPAIDSFKHIEYNKDKILGPYTLEAFEDALRAHFPRWEPVGDVTPTRRMYVAFKTSNELDLSSPLPMLFPETLALYSRRLATHEGAEYWSRVYLHEGDIHKQTTLDLAEREARILTTLDGPHFPRVRGFHAAKEGYSVVRLERVEGEPLTAAAAAIGADPARFAAFAGDCLSILAALARAGVTHRDVKADNVIVRDGRPVLIDFGWAVSATERCFAPRWLGGEGRPPDGIFDDVYSMGRLLQAVDGGRNPAFAPVLELMADPDAALRVSDLAVLAALFQEVSAR